MRNVFEIYTRLRVSYNILRRGIFEKIKGILFEVKLVTIGKAFEMSLTVNLFLISVFLQRHLQHFHNFI